MKILALAASLRKDSLNRKLLALAVPVAREAGVEVDHADFREFEMPMYDGDAETATGLPAGAQKLVHRIAAAQGILLATPEYNFSIPGTLKNAIDWVSRARPVPLTGKSALLLTASPGPYGGARSALATRVPLEALGVHVYPGSYSLVHAAAALDEQGKLKDPAAQERLANLVRAWLAVAARIGAA
jgi:chromate reductase